MVSEKMKLKYGVTVLLFEITQRHLWVCVNYGLVYSKDFLFEKVDDRSLRIKDKLNPLTCHFDRTSKLPSSSVPSCALF